MLIGLEGHERGYVRVVVASRSDVFRVDERRDDNLLSVEVRGGLAGKDDGFPAVQRPFRGHVYLADEGGVSRRVYRDKALVESGRQCCRMDACQDFRLVNGLVQDRSPDALLGRGERCVDVERNGLGAVPVRRHGFAEGVRKPVGCRDENLAYRLR